MKKIPIGASLVSINKHKIIWFALFIFTSITVNAQNQTISLAGGAMTIQDVFREIETQTGLSIDYNHSRLDVTRQVNLQLSDTSLKNVLDEVLKTSGFTYSIERGHIIIKQETTETIPVGSDEKQNVTGVILDEKGDPVIGANIIEKGTINGVISNIDGEFSLLVKRNAALQISYIGYFSQEFFTQGKTDLRIVLKEDNQFLDEVVIVGYGIQKKANLTGAVSQVQMSEVLGNRPVVDAKAALQGSIPGLVITGGSSPGESREINIRGVNSINGGSPLVLVDNVPGTLDLINPEDIESISVLKDASAAAIYGARGAFGVILVNTKRAKKGTKLSINYNTNIAFQKSVNRPKSASVEQILATYLEWYDDGKYYAQSQDLKNGWVM